MRLTRSRFGFTLAAAALSFTPAAALGQTRSENTVYQFQSGSETRWASPENRTGEKGAAGRENRGAKGHAWDSVAAGESYVLAEVDGPGIIDRIWLTTADRSPENLRAMRLDFYWDGASTPAVSVPLGDFFVAGAGELKRMETAFVESPEARSFVSTFPMPFRKGARLVLTNESAKEIFPLYYDVNYRKLDRLPPDALYFHAYWSRDRATKLAQDLRILPRLQGRGRFLGTSVAVLTNPVYGKSWWGEGEVRMFLDGDRALPSLSGTGTEDYIGTGWGQGAYIHRYQGSPVADESTGRWSFYRFHVPDPIFFDRDIEVTVQQMGGWPKKDVLRLQQQGAPLIPVSVDSGPRSVFRQLLAGDRPIPLTDPSLPEGWTNFYRSDDVAAVAYFYLDRPENGLPRLAPVAERTAALRKPPEVQNPAPPTVGPTSDN